MCRVEPAEWSRRQGNPTEGPSRGQSLTWSVWRHLSLHWLLTPSPLLPLLCVERYTLTYSITFTHVGSYKALPSFAFASLSLHVELYLCIYTFLSSLLNVLHNNGFYNLIFIMSILYYFKMQVFNTINVIYFIKGFQVFFSLWEHIYIYFA